MAPTDGRVAKPEQWWGCRCGTRSEGEALHSNITDDYL